VSKQLALIQVGKIQVHLPWGDVVVLIWLGIGCSEEHVPWEGGSGVRSSEPIGQSLVSIHAICHYYKDGKLNYKNYSQGFWGFGVLPT
jgi:hypothetical protein